MVLIKPPDNYNPDQKLEDMEEGSEKAKYIGGKGHHTRDIVMKC
jgi:hypothetical protein